MLDPRSLTQTRSSSPASALNGAEVPVSTRENLRRLRRTGYVEARAPLEADDLGQSGDDLVCPDSGGAPVIERVPLDVFAGGLSEGFFELVADLAEHAAESSTPGLGRFPQ